MTELFEPTSELDWRLAGCATALLGELNRAGVLEAPDIHVAARLGVLGGESEESVLLAVALAVRAVRRGSVCVDLTEVARLAPETAWPEPGAWVAAVRASPLVAAGAIRYELGLLYLDRYHRLEVQVAADLSARLAEPPPAVDESTLQTALTQVRGAHFSDEQEAAAVQTARQRTTVLTGGPGTGKTTTVARLLVLLAAQAAARGERLSVALAAPTGKAATRLHEAVREEWAALVADGSLAAADLAPIGSPDVLTLHRLLGWRPGNNTRFVHNRGNRLKYDAIVVDETSMVELTMMARLLEAVRPQTRLLLVGDPQQLSPVGAGAVLSDLVAGYRDRPESPVASLTRNYRSTPDILRLAESLARPEPDADEVLEVLRSRSSEVQFLETEDPAAALRDDLLASALAIRDAAVVGDAAAAVEALDRHRLLCAHREGPFGVRHWNRQVETWLAEHLGVGLYEQWYVGRPVLVTSNDYGLDVYNGETGVVVAGAAPSDRPRAWIAGSHGLKDYAPGRLNTIETMHAMTIHKGQGSQADRVTVLLPEADSRLLTRELFYTAVTRARAHVRVIGSEAAVRAAVLTTAQRATGLRQRLR